MTTEQLTELRRLLAEAQRSDRSLSECSRAIDVCANSAYLALPSLLAAAEREAKLRKLLARLLKENDGCPPKLASDCAAALAEGGGK